MQIMRKNIVFISFISLCVIMFLVPSLFMIFFRSDETIGNESVTEWPALTTEEGSFNTKLLEEMGDYFETHYAFRPQLITADAYVQSSVFRVSNTDPVTAGRDGWLYYSSTLKDYLGEEPLSERGVWNIAHNLSLAQNYVSAMGAGFLFFVPPNKNTLYPEHMPYYYDVRVSDIHNRDHLRERLEEAGVAYLDLFQLFGSREETLYLKQDSHWNNKGAMMVYNAFLEMLGQEHDTYEDAAVAYGPIHKGDLSNIIYPSDQSLEEDYQYEYDGAFEYVPGPASSDPVSVEDFRIETVNESASGTLLMYRDSFGNTLIPITANAFAHGYYAKSTPYPIARDMQQYSPDYVVIELVERNIRNLAANPAIVPSPRRNIDPMDLTAHPDVETEIQVHRSDAGYVVFRGNVSPANLTVDTRIYVAIEMQDGGAALFEAFTITDEESDYSYAVYLPLTQFGSLENAQGRKVMVYTDES